MVSSKALEYATRFGITIEGVNAIVDYRNECKRMYAEMKDNIRNFRDELNLKEMFDRIHKLGEARDYVLETMDNTSKTSKTSKTKTSKNVKYDIFYDDGDLSIKVDSKSYFKKTEADLKKYSKNVVKYILRFQGLGIPKNSSDIASACDCINAIEEYSEEIGTAQGDACEEIDNIKNMLPCTQGSERAELKAKIQRRNDFIKTTNESLKALEKAKEYFEGIDETIDYYKLEVANASGDYDNEYVDEWEAIAGRT
ncbi:hypothetical protein PBCVAN69C_097R [Paramecium bursaria Chlorella virus AN69C]|uniref:Uncharacterized protein n=1 Tax=Paramecium bursaria Chlorella virus IL3A TaxID=46019 RepID=M1HUA3_PBCVI|nr:hypothetical protein PBCVAN69C_097R [Paramecium bursaria Chlorella virus AN69C]AGE53764.1 hypothetical protein PBCVIL3A_091R [Paramecium bursaria Chlorella virus IL3A]